jgi:hypothetical protein
MIMHNAQPMEKMGISAIQKRFPLIPTQKMVFCNILAAKNGF